MELQRRSDVVLVGKAIRDRWPIPDEVRAKIVERLLEIVTSSDSEPRDVNQAARVLVSIDKQNVDLDRAVENLTFDELKEELRQRLIVITAAESDTEVKKVGKRRNT